MLSKMIFLSIVAQTWPVGAAHTAFYYEGFIWLWGGRQRRRGKWQDLPPNVVWRIDANTNEFEREVRTRTGKPKTTRRTTMRRE